MLHALDLFTRRPPHALPLSPTLPDVKSDTASYIHLQTLYRNQAIAERDEFARILEEVRVKAGVQKPIPTLLVDEFVKNCHQLKILKGKLLGDDDDAVLSEFSFDFDVLRSS
jgi:amyloid beta precursor protein binding protein 1